ncbi:MAG: hypothetical protein K2K55_01550 [Duncaniella sp.]|nr:hypothetical protein [Duncaniella sp.]
MKHLFLPLALLAALSADAQYPASREDLVTTYTGTYEDYFDQGVPERNVTLSIYVTDDLAPDEIYITNWYQGADVKATVNLATRTISIAEQVVFQNPYYGGISFTGVYVDTYSKLQFATQPYKLLISDDGTLSDATFGNGFGFGKRGLGFMSAGHNLSVRDINRPASIETIESEDNVETEYYNLQGMRVTPDVKGVIICRKGSEIKKIVR